MTGRGNSTRGSMLRGKQNEDFKFRMARVIECGQMIIYNCSFRPVFCDLEDDGLLTGTMVDIDRQHS